MNWVRVYELSGDTTKIDLMQKASLDTSGLGVSLSPALIGSKEWWQMAEDGRLPRTEVEGKITKVYWASMGDWPEFELMAEDGTTSRWTREGDYVRYVEGLKARLAFVLHPWKQPQRFGLGAHSKLVVYIDVEDSPRRSDRRVPGPGGV
jgi:hypothetical protein